MQNRITIFDEGGEEFLRQKSTEVDFKKDNIEEIIASLEHYCKENLCFAMAAVQIGFPKKIIYFKISKYDPKLYNSNDYNEAKVIINPVIISRKGRTSFWEACASCGNNTGLVERPYEIKVEYFDKEGKKHKKTFRGFESTVFSHEFDHLDGILHMDIAKKNIQLNSEERAEFRKKNKYEIISKDCEFESINNIKLL